VKYFIQHGWYGCETGCCGTEIVSEDDEVRLFDFGEPDEGDTVDDVIARGREVLSQKLKPGDTVELGDRGFASWCYWRQPE
jgi:hypothetical protein